MVCFALPCNLIYCSCKRSFAVSGQCIQYFHVFFCPKIVVICLTEYNYKVEAIWKTQCYGRLIISCYFFDLSKGSVDMIHFSSHDTFRFTVY